MGVEAAALLLALGLTRGAPRRLSPNPRPLNLEENHIRPGRGVSGVRHQQRALVIDRELYVHQGWMGDRER